MLAVSSMSSWPLISYTVTGDCHPVSRSEKHAQWWPPAPDSPWCSPHLSIRRTSLSQCKILQMCHQSLCYPTWSTLCLLCPLACSVKPNRTVWDCLISHSWPFLLGQLQPLVNLHTVTGLRIETSKAVYVSYYRAISGVKSVCISPSVPWENTTWVWWRGTWLVAVFSLRQRTTHTTQSFCLAVGISPGLSVDMGRDRKFPVVIVSLFHSPTH